jgi:uncharacterized protein (DUF1778 family)
MAETVEKKASRATPGSASTARLAARIPPELHALIKHAAEISGRSMTDFVVEAATAAAQRAVEQSNVMRLSVADSQVLAEALLNPPTPNSALERAFVRRTQLLREE